MSRDYVDSFLSEMKRPGQQKKTLTREVLTSNAASFFGAGSETLRSTTEWLMMMCAVKPELQSRMQREIDTVIGERGPGSHVLWEDRTRMPYTQAFIWEMARCEPVNPFGFMRRTYRHGSQFSGSAPNLDYSSQRDYTQCPDSKSKRSCPGEAVANVVTFLFLTSILQHFTVEVPTGGPTLAFDEVLGLSLRPRSQELVFRAREVLS
ncbi:hypothetical protein MTO96_006420 [Rhipicephalus appendiculatus]